MDPWSAFNESDNQCPSIRVRVCSSHLYCLPIDKYSVVDVRHSVSSTTLVHSRCTHCNESFDSRLVQLAVHLPEGVVSSSSQPAFKYIPATPSRANPPQIVCHRIASSSSTRARSEEAAEPGRRGASFAEEASICRRVIRILRWNRTKNFLIISRSIERNSN